MSDDKHTLSETMARVFDRSNKDIEALNAYRDTVNRIDDFFEYTNESTKDRDFIHNQLDKLTEKLKTIYDD